MNDIFVRIKLCVIVLFHYHHMVQTTIATEGLTEFLK